MTEHTVWHRLRNVKNPRAWRLCPACNRRMPRVPTWRTMCKKCDPVRTVD